MNAHSTLYYAGEFSLCLLFAAASTLVHQNAPQAGNLDEKTTGSNVRASQLIGMNIQNPEGEGVGEVHDIVVDANNGRVRYAAVTYGGLFGLGNKLFAVPFEAFEVRTQADDRHEYVLVLDVTQEQLDGAKGFDEDNWPDFADSNFTEELDRRYKVDRRRGARRSRDRQIDVNVDREGVDVDLESAPRN